MTILGLIKINDKETIDHFLEKNDFVEVFKNLDTNLKIIF